MCIYAYIYICIFACITCRCIYIYNTLSGQYDIMLCLRSEGVERQKRCSCAEFD